MSEHSKRYARFAAHLAAQGYHAYAWDHRGHGETTAPDAVQGQFARRNGLDTVIADTMAIRDMAPRAIRPARAPLRPFHGRDDLPEHGAEASDSFAGFAVWNFDFGTASSMPLMRLLLGVGEMAEGSDVPSSILPRMTFDAWGKAIPAIVRCSTGSPTSRGSGRLYRRSALRLPLYGLALVRCRRGRRPRCEQGKPLPHPEDKPIMLVGGGKDPATRGAKGIHWLESVCRALAFPKSQSRSIRKRATKASMISLQSRPQQTLSTGRQHLPSAMSHQIS